MREKVIVLVVRGVMPALAVIRRQFIDDRSTVDFACLKPSAPTAHRYMRIDTLYRNHRRAVRSTDALCLPFDADYRVVDVLDFSEFHVRAEARHCSRERHCEFGNWSNVIVLPRPSCTVFVNLKRCQHVYAALKATVHLLLPNSRVYFADVRLRALGNERTDQQRTQHC